jgi:glycerate 2-kinase
VRAPATPAERIWRAAIGAADPFEAVRRSLAPDDEALRGARRIRVVGAGKAAVPMAEAAVAALGDGIADGLVVAKRGHGGERGRVGRIAIAEGGHPLPDAGGARAAARLEALLRDDPDERDLVVVLLSGGGSSLLALPADGTGLEELRAASDALILGGADIRRLNAVRKHLTRLSGGLLARAAAPARVVSLILSDVIGDPLDVIASGPTAPDPTTFGDALAAIRGLGLEGRVPPAVLDLLRRGVAGEIPETPKPGDAVFDRVDNRIVGGNRIAVEAAALEAQRLGLHAEIVTTTFRGEARDRGLDLAGVAASPLPRPTCFLYGGETTVTVRGRGRGGRNQELALAAALGLERRGASNACVVAISTDGQDGPTDAAGAIVDSSTCARIRAAGIDPEAALADNDSYVALDAAGALIRTGPTRTNVADVAFVLV